jgi:hypothetical protein
MRASVQFHVLLDIRGFLLATSGSLILAWVGQLTWHDMTVWGKDLVLVFIGSRTGESISLGIGMKVIHYFLIGLALLFMGLLTSLTKRNKIKNPHINHSTRQSEKEKGLSWCSHSFGYLGSLPDFESVPEECLTCQKMLECRNVRTQEKDH